MERQTTLRKIKYKDLSFWLKIAVVGGLIAFFEFCIMFCIGFMAGLSGV